MRVLQWTADATTSHGMQTYILLLLSAGKLEYHIALLHDLCEFNIQMENTFFRREICLPMPNLNVQSVVGIVMRSNLFELNFGDGKWYSRARNSQGDCWFRVIFFLNVDLMKIKYKIVKDITFENMWMVFTDHVCLLFLKILCTKLLTVPYPKMLFFFFFCV